MAQEYPLASGQGGGARWSVDHLFLDQDAIPTIVEVKRSSDTRIRREVIGQLIEYAAKGVKYWPIERVRGQFEAQCEMSQLDPSEAIHETFGESLDIDVLWESARLNLETGRVRMIFVGDVIPSELQRVVEFLNEQMTRAEVLALELRYYKTGELTTLVPKVFGQTGKAQQLKESAPRVSLDDFLHSVSEPHGGTAAQVVSRIVEWSINQHLAVSVEGLKEGAALWSGLNTTLGMYWPIHLRHDGKLFISFQALSKREPFSDEALRRELLQRLNQAKGLALAPNLTGRPYISLEQLEDNDTLQAVLLAPTWLMDKIRDHAEHTPEAQRVMGAEPPASQG